MKPLLLVFGRLLPFFDPLPPSAVAVAWGHKSLEDIVGNWTDVTSEVINGVPLPEKMKPFINSTAVEALKRKNASATVSLSSL